MADECDEQTTALIAQLLSEDNHYAEAGYSEEDQNDDDSDAEFQGSNRRKRAKKGVPARPVCPRKTSHPITSLVMHVPGTCSGPTATPEEDQRHRSTTDTPSRRCKRSSCGNHKRR
jgi:hypothetical protein